MENIKKQLRIAAFGECGEDSGKRRIFVYDNLRFLLIFLVVVGHALDDFTEPEPTDMQPQQLNELLRGIFLFIYAFHMPLFLFISGLFTKRRADKINWNSVISYVLLGFWLKILLAFAKMLFEQGDESDYFSLMDGDGVYWYLFVLAFYKIFCFALRNVKPASLMALSVCLALVSGYDAELGNWLNLSRTVVFFPFYYAGFCLEPKSLLDFTRKIYVKIFSAAALAVWFWLCFFKFDKVSQFRRLFTGRNSFDKIQMPNCEFWDRGEAMLISAVLCLALISLLPDIRLPFITKFGNRTLQVYFWHRPVLYYLIYAGYSDEIIAAFPNCWWIVYIAVALLITILLSLGIFGKPLNAFIRSVGTFSAKTEKQT
jgi:fucose 4-O-acetylase-like acetyltransferase